MKSILLIEDNEQNTYLVTYLLERHGYTVVPAENGARGIEIASTLEPDIVLLDIQLPVMDGYSVARALREMPGCRCSRIIAVTSHAMAGDRERALASGFDGYIEKPIDPETFVAEIAAYVAKSARTGGPA